MANCEQIAALIEQIARDAASLRLVPIPHPGKTFYENRITQYRAEVIRLQAQQGGQS